MSWFDPDEPYISFEITAYIDHLTKAGRKKFFKQLGDELDRRDVETWDYTLSKGNKIATITGVTTLDIFEDVQYLLDKWDVDYEKSCDRASDFYNNPEPDYPSYNDDPWD